MAGIPDVSGASSLSGLANKLPSRRNSSVTLEFLREGRHNRPGKALAGAQQLPPTTREDRLASTGRPLAEADAIRSAVSKSLGGKQAVRSSAKKPYGLRPKAPNLNQAE